MRVNWAITEGDARGNHLGFAVHNRESRKALEAEGVELDPAADISLSVCSPFHYQRPRAGKVHGLYTAWDTTTLPRSADSLLEADYVVVTAGYLVPVMRTRMREDADIHVCPLGVDYKAFAYPKGKRRRLKRGERMTALWLGAPNPRKGYAFVLEAMRALASFPIDFYMKTTLWDDNPETVEVMKSNGNARVILDTRKVPFDELVGLYHKAHVFLLPTMGEGFGLSLAEAMAAGLPCIFTPWSGVTEYCDGRVAFPLKYELQTLHIEPNMPKETPGYDDLCCDAELAVPDLQSLCERIVQVFSNYKPAVAKGQLAACRMKSRFTWRHTGQRLKGILEEVEGKWLQA